MNSSTVIAAGTTVPDDLQLAIIYSARYLVTACVVIGTVVDPITVWIWMNPVSGVSANARIYYLTLALGETPNLIIFYTLGFSLGLGLPWTVREFWTPQNNSYTCQFIWWIWLSSEMIACWSLCALCIERMYAVFKPMKVASVFTRKRIKIFAIALFLIGYVTNLPAWWVNSASNGRCGNIFDLGWIGLARFWQAQLSCMALPVFIALLGNVVLLWKIGKAARQRAHTLGLNKAKKKSTKDLLATYIVVALSVSHILFYVPSNFATIAMDMAGSLYPDWPGNRFTLRFSQLWQSFTVVPHCINFFVYATLIPGFQRQVMKIFCCGRTPSNSKMSDDKDDSQITL